MCLKEQRCTYIEGFWHSTKHLKCSRVKRSCIKTVVPNIFSFWMSCNIVFVLESSTATKNRVNITLWWLYWMYRMCLPKNSRVKSQWPGKEDEANPGMANWGAGHYVKKDSWLSHASCRGINLVHCVWKPCCSTLHPAAQTLWSSFPFRTVKGLFSCIPVLVRQGQAIESQR